MIRLKRQSAASRAAHGQAAAKAALVAALALTPLVVSPWTSEIWESAKIVFFSLCAAVGTISLLWPWRKSRPTFHLTIVDICLATAVIVSFLGLLVTASMRTTIIGFPGYANDSLIAVVAGALLLTIAGHATWTRLEWLGAAAAIVAGWTLVLLIQIFQFSGVYLFGFSASHSPSFTLAGNSLRTAGLLAVAAASFALGAWFMAGKHWWRRLLFVPVVAAFLTLVIIDDPISWLALACASTVPVLLGAVRPALRQAVIGGVILLALALVGWAVPFGARTTLAPTDLLLPVRESASVVVRTISHAPVIGTGLSTFYYDFVRFRPDSFNATALWQFRFLKAGNQAWQWLAMTGAVGTIAAVGLAAVLGWAAVRGARRSNGDPSYLFALSGLGLSLILIFLVPFTLSLAVLYLAGLSLFLAWYRASGLEFPAWQWRWPRPAAVAVAVVTFCVIASGLWQLGRASAGSIFRQRALTLQSAGTPLETVKNRLERGAALDPGEPLVNIALAEEQLAIVRQQFNQGSLTNEAATQQIRAALTLADKSIKLDPKNPARYEQVIDLYQTLAQYVADADIGAAELYRKLIALEPKNPRNEFGLGQTLLVSADRLAHEADSITSDSDRAARQKDAMAAVTEAVAHLDRALALRPDYPDAEFRLALAEELEGKTAEARDRLVRLSGRYPNSSNIWYELGRLQLATGQKDEAVRSFQQVIALFPNNSNAHYQLGLIYAGQEKIGLAEQEFETVLGLNPGNADVQTKLDELKNKK